MRKKIRKNSFFKAVIGTILICVLSGCATRYHSSGLTGGYSEIKTTSDTFIVTFKGNGYTSSERVLKYALKRASELTVQNGYKYFSIISSADQTSSYDYSNTQSNVYGSANSYHHSNFSNTNVYGYGSSSTYSGHVTKPGVSVVIKCFKAKPWFEDVIDAEYYLANN